MKSIEAIKIEFLNIKIEDLDALISYYSKDSRKGVQSLIKKAIKSKDDYLFEIDRLKKMQTYENEFYKNGARHIAGIDEVGRGPLAGPVVSAAVILKKETELIGLNDSKKVSEKNRQRLFFEINKTAIDIKISLVNNNLIDEINILQATIKSMEDAINKLETTPDQLIIDALNLPNIKIPKLSIPKADELSASVAAASIIAKVTRDEMMDKYHEIYPEYSFDKNKGYGTKEHLDAIKKYGICPIHRKSFLKNFL